MKTFALGALSFALAAVGAMGGTLPTTQIRGEYVETRTADVYTGPCFANSEGGLSGELAVFGWKIDKGTWQGVTLDGLSVVGVVRAQHTLGDSFEGPNSAKAVLIVDQKAGIEQRLALRQFALKMAGDLLADVVRIEYQPIDLKVNGESIHSRNVTLTAGNLAKIATRPMTDSDQVCHNEEVWYEPLTPVDHAMPAYTLANQYKGQGLGTQWSYPGARSSFVGTFHYGD